MRFRHSAAPAAGVASEVPAATVAQVRRPGAWWLIWSGLTVVTAAVATAADAALLQASRDFFTGGFLSADHATSALQGLAFLVVAFALNAAMLGAAIALALSAGARLGLTRMAVAVAASGFALVPVGLAQFVEYQLLTHLGDLFDLGLMFDLSGRSPGEVFAVSWPQLAQLGLMFGGVVAVLGTIVWTVRRRGGRAMPTVSLRHTIVLAVVLIAGGAAATLAARGSSDVFDNGLRRTPAGRFLGALVNLASDVDRDGHGLLGRPPDPDLFDASVRPYAVDVPGNGIDENGVGGDLPRELPPYVETWDAHRPWRATPDVVLIVLESFRADVLEASVDGRPVSPVLAGLASRGISSSLAYSHNGYTVQSRRHLFSGSAADLESRTTLIDDFKARGYDTAYFSAQDESFGGPEQGIGFERADIAYDARADRARRVSTFTTAGSLAVSHEVLGGRVAEFLDGRRSSRPLFLYVNFHDTHFPYHHKDIQPIVGRTVLEQSRISPSRAGDLRAMYLNTAANVDRAVGRLLDHVTRTLGREPGVIVLSDHGESLYDEGFLGHGYALNEAQTRIPLVVANLPLTIREPFGQADLRPAIHDALARHPAGTQAPELIRDDAKVVFQYLGSLDRPRALAFTSTSGRVIYDLRDRRAFIDGAWYSDRELNGEERRRVLDLVHTWERMLIARQRSNESS